MTETVEPTTPRDAIGLSERLRQWVTDWDGSQMQDGEPPRDGIHCDIIREAATALDALQGEISQWANEVARYKAYAEKFDEENAALQARVKELEEQRDEARKASNLGCDARDGGAHSIMVQGSYKFCTGCGSTIRTPTLQERARAAESRVKVFEVELNGAIERSKMLLDAKIHWMDRALRAEQERDEAVALLVRVNTLAKMPAWRRMPDGASFYTTPLAGDIDAAIRRLAAGTEKEGE